MSRKSKKVFPNSTVDAFHEDGDIKIVKSTPDHAGYLQHRLRPDDVRECLVHGSTPWRALHIPFRIKNADTWTALYKDEPVCMYGVVPFVADKDFVSATVWMLGSVVLDENPLKFCKTAQQVIDWLNMQYDMLENVVPADHQRTIQWLDRMGFIFAEVPTVINGFSCYRFVRCEKSIEVRFE